MPPYYDVESDNGAPSGSEYAESESLSDKEMDDPGMSFEGDHDRLGDSEIESLEDCLSEEQTWDLGMTELDMISRGYQDSQSVDPSAAVAPRQLFNGNAHPPAYYQTKIQRFNDDPRMREKYLRKVYAKKTESGLISVLHNWKSFCIHIQRPWLHTMKNIDLGLVESYLHFHLNQKRGKNGQRKKATTKVQSLRSHWDSFRMLFRRETLMEIDQLVAQTSVNNLINTLVNDFNLSSEKTDNRPMTIDQLKLQIETTLRTTEMAFNLGEQRVLTVLFLLLLAPAGSRPESVLQIQHRHIEIVLHQVKDTTLPPKLVIYMQLEFTKTRMGPKGMKTFILPEVIHDPSLFLSPHVFLLAVLFHRRAFRVERLNDDPSLLSRLKVKDGEMQLPIPLKEELGSEPIFRRAERSVTGHRPSNDRIPYSSMSKWVQRVGKILGYENNVICYTLRYMAGNNLNQSNDVSFQLQNLIMDHAPNSDVFQKSYLNRNVTFDVWALQRGIAQQKDVVKEAASFGHRRSTNRPITLSPQQAAALKDHPEYKHYEGELRKQRRGSPQWHKAQREVKSALERLRYAAIKNATGKLWTTQYATEQIEQQLGEAGADVPIVAGGSASTSAPVNRRVQRQDRMSPAQEKMVKALLQPIQTTLEMQLQVRSDAISAIQAYCSAKEPIMTKMRKEKQKAPVPTIMLEMPAGKRDAELARLRRSVIAQHENQRLFNCYICIGEALTLPPMDPNLPDLCRDYATNVSLSRHFKFQHLKFMDQANLPPCPVCLPEAKFGNIMYLQSHAMRVHGIYQAKIWGG